MLGKCFLNFWAWLVAKTYLCVERVDEYINKKVDEFLEEEK